MDIRLLLLLLALTPLGVADAKDREFSPVANPGQSIEFDDGEAYVTARTGRAVVMASFIPRDKKSAWIKLGIKNVSDVAFNISDASVAVASGGTPLPVMTYAERIKELKRKEMWADIGAGLAAGANNMAAANAGYQRHQGTYNSTTNASVYGAGGSAYGTATTSGTYFGSSYNASAAFQAQQQANAENQAIFDRQQQNAEFGRRDLQDRALKSNTVSPGEFVLGDVRFSLPKRQKGSDSEVIITVDVAGEPISFQFKEQR